MDAMYDLFGCLERTIAELELSRFAFRQKPTLIQTTADLYHC